MPTRTSLRNLSIDELRQMVLDLQNENNHLNIQLQNQSILRQDFVTLNETNQN